MVPVKDLYSIPEYYDIAFSFRDIRQEVDVFEECFRRYSKIPVRRVLELASGNSPHFQELARRGYEYIGIDINEGMLAYAQHKAEVLGIPATFIKADMRCFSLERHVDFVYTMISSLYSITTDDLLSHFAAVANALNPGGLYFLDWYICFQWDEPSREYYSWTIERGEVKIFVEYLRETVIDRVAQIGKYKCSMDVLDHGKKVCLESIEVSRVVFPQEFLLLVEKSGKFEFIGWWNHWNFDEPVEKAEHVSRPITLIRRLQ